MRRAGLAASAVLVLAACDEKSEPTTAPQARSQAVVASGPAPAPTPMAAPDPTAAARAAEQAAAKQKQVICAHQLGQPAKEAPKASVSRAGQTSLLPEKLPIGPGHWTWVNLWAAWCVPCREEMPRLVSWEQKAATEQTTLKVAFVSIDDDARQLESLLAGANPAGLKASYWLKDGNERATWLKEAGLQGEPELPAHVLVDPTGKIRCRQQGAIEDADFGEVLKILRGQRGRVSAEQKGDGLHGFGESGEH
ncbi:MAG TPA: TlpA disulfide reductase family protein [Polyangiaceae bacterium]|nr:TlpA disulfide reductase family protein [Polyangiaceae bacterium]